jgi:hypothetical protein
MSKSDPEPASRNGLMRAAAGAIAAAAVALIAVLLATSNDGHSRTTVTTGTDPQKAGPSTQTELTIRPHETMRDIPRSFFGFSTEYWTLPVDERHIAIYRRVISQLHVPGDGPFVPRVGGDSSDHTFYDPRLRRLPTWAFDLTPTFVARTARVVRELRLHVILDLNLVTSTPRLAGGWAKEAEAVMPRGSIIGFEIGNEPDLYNRTFWLATTKDDQFGGRILPDGITPTSYAASFNSYAHVLARVAPHVPLVAPALADPYGGVNWISTLLAGPHPGLGVISGHRYPYAACANPGSPVYPTIDRVLSEHATAGMAQTIKPAVRLAKRAGLPFRLTELNSVTCGGLAGVSNTFATALWAPDAEFELMRAGAHAINLHAREFAINDPFTFDVSGMVARPLLYGLILFTRTLGPDSRLVTARLHTDSPHLKAWAVKVRADTLHVLMINKGPKSLMVNLDIPATGPARVERLLAPSPGSPSSVTLGGQSLDRDGIWVGTPQRETVRPVAHRYSLALTRYSAALLTVKIARGALG